MLRFWMEIVYRACTDSIALFEQNPRLLFLGLLGAFITAVLVRIFRGKEAFMEHLKANILIAFGGALITWMFVFLWTLLWMPHTIRIEADGLPLPTLERNNISPPLGWEHAGSPRHMSGISVPQLKLKIDIVGTGEMRYGNYDGAVAMVIANLINDGAPSIADGWQLKLILSDGRSEETTPMYVDPANVLEGDNPEGGGGPWKLSAADLLYVKAMERPLEKGNEIRGVLIFKFPDFAIDDIKKAGTKFVLSCHDFDRTKVTATLVFTGKAQPMSWFAGLHPIPH